MVVGRKDTKKINRKLKKCMFSMRDRFYRKYYRGLYQWAYTRET